MSKLDTILIDGRTYSWRRIRELRRRQIEKWEAAQPVQPALFNLKDDYRPEPERTAAINQSPHAKSFARSWSFRRLARRSRIPLEHELVSKQG